MNDENENEKAIAEIVFHYYLSDGSHQMGAISRNKCEQEMLNVFLELCEDYGVYSEILSLARQEGGIKDVWRVISSNANGITAIAAVVALFFAGATYFENRPDEEKKRLEKCLLKLQIQDLSKKKLKNSQDCDFEEGVSGVAALNDLENNKKALLSRSAFFKSLDSEKSVEKFGASSNLIGAGEFHVGKNDFQRLLIPAPRKEIQPVDYVEISLISPVFRSRKYKWRGLVGDNVINFKISDRSFNRLVKNQKFGFKNGDVLECSMKIKGDVDYFGDWGKKDIFVTKVHAIVTGGKRSVLSSDARENLINSVDLKSQMDLFEG